jgi:hypothetical protein
MKLLSDMDRVARHLAKMGWEVQGLKGSQDDGSDDSPLEGMAGQSNGLTHMRHQVK